MHTYTHRHIGILYIKGCTFKMETVPLTTVRPFVIDSVSLVKTGIPPQEDEQVQSYLSEKARRKGGREGGREGRELLSVFLSTLRCRS